MAIRQRAIIETTRLTRSSDLMRSQVINKLMTCFDEGINNNFMKSIDNYAYSNLPIDKQIHLEKRLSIRELDARMKKNIK